MLAAKSKKLMMKEEFSTVSDAPNMLLSHIEHIGRWV